MPSSDKPPTVGLVVPDPVPRTFDGGVDNRIDRPAIRLVSGAIADDDLTDIARAADQRQRIPTIPAGRATAPTVPIPDNLVTLVRMSLVALFGEGANIHAFRRDDGRIEVSATLGPVEAEALVAAAEWARGEK